MPWSVVSHRGQATWGITENTLEAFDLAFAQGAHACELDVRLTADRDFVVMHDDTTTRTCGTARIVHRTSTARMLRTATRTGQLVPSLEAVLDANRGRELWVEVKEDPDGRWDLDTAARLGRLVADRGMHDRVTFLSFDLPVLLDIRSAAPELRASWVWFQPGSRGLSEWVYAHVPLSRDGGVSGLALHANEGSWRQARRAGLHGILTGDCAPAHTDWGVLPCATRS